MITVNQFKSIRSKPMAEIEGAIDRALREAAESGKREAVIAIGSWPRDLVEHLLRAYEDAGWNGCFLHDSRDGNCIQLRLP